MNMKMGIISLMVVICSALYSTLNNPHLADSADVNDEDQEYDDEDDNYDHHFDYH